MNLANWQLGTGEAPVKIMILNNGYLGMVREIQEKIHGGRYYQTRMEGNPDFVKLADAYGIEGFRVESQEKIVWGIKKLLNCDGPIIAEFVIDPMANVIPIQGGKEDEAHIRVLAETSGVLSKVSGLFSRRGFNIYSLAVGMTEDPTVSRITIVVEGDSYIVEQVIKQPNKLIDVIKVSRIEEDS